MEKQSIFSDWLKNLDDSFSAVILRLDSESIALLNMAFQEGYEKGLKEKQKVNYEEWNQK